MQASTKRVETFSDGVIAIVITIMILELKIPDFNTTKDENSIYYHLIKVLPHFAAYIFSFTMVGILWIQHHHLYHLLERTNNFFLGQNLFFLFWISLIPFATGNMGANPILPVSTALYGFIMFMSSLSLTWMRIYTIKKKFVHTDNERAIRKKLFNINLKAKKQSHIISFLYLASIPLAYLNIYASYLCFLVPIIIFLIPSGQNDEAVENKVIEKNI